MALTKQARDNNDMLIREADKLLSHLNDHVFTPLGIPVIPLDGTATPTPDISLDDLLPRTRDEMALKDLINLDLLSPSKRKALQHIREQGQNPIAKTYSTFSESGIAHYKIDITHAMVAAKAMANIALLVRRVAKRNNDGGEIFSVGDLKFLGITAFYIAEKILQKGILKINRKRLTEALTPGAKDDGESAIGLLKIFTNFICAVDDPLYEKRKAEDYSGIYALIPKKVALFIPVRNDLRKDNILAMGLDSIALGEYLDKELFPALEAEKVNAVSAATVAEATVSVIAEAPPLEPPATSVQSDDLSENIKRLIEERARYQELQESMDKLREERSALEKVIARGRHIQGELKEKIRIDAEKVVSYAPALQSTKIQLAKQIEENSIALGALQIQDEKSHKKMRKLDEAIKNIDSELPSLKKTIDEQSDVLEKILQKKQTELQEKIKLAEDAVGVLGAAKDALNHELDTGPHRAHELSPRYIQINAEFSQHIKDLTALGATAQAYVSSLKGIEKALPAGRGFALARQAERLAISISEIKEAVETHVKALPAPELTKLLEKTERFKKDMQVVMDEIAVLKQKVSDAYRIPALRDQRSQLHDDYQAILDKVKLLHKECVGLRTEYSTQTSEVESKLKQYLGGAPLDNQFTNLEICLNACDELNSYCNERINSVAYKLHLFSHSDDVIRDNAIVDLQNKLLSTDEDFKSNREALEGALLGVICDNKYKPRRFGDYEKSLQFHALKIAYDLDLTGVISKVDSKVKEHFTKVAQEKHIAIRGLVK